MSDVETIRGRIYHFPDETPVVQLQCRWCHAIADDTEPGASREAVRTLRGRMERRGWVVANPSDEDDARTWRDTPDYCSTECAHGIGESAIDCAMREEVRHAE